jgi:PhnB protein
MLTDASEVFFIHFKNSNSATRLIKNYKKINVMVVNPYLNFNGNTEEVFNFYKSVFGGEFAMVMRFCDIPPGEEEKEGCAEGSIPEAEKNKIMHIALPLGKSMLMGTDVTEGMPQVKHGTGHYICISADSRADADKFFDGLALGGEIEMAMQDMFWGDYFGSLTDKYGVQWMITFNAEQQGKVAE